MNVSNARHVRGLAALVIGAVAGIAGTVAAYSLKSARIASSSSADIQNPTPLEIDRAPAPLVTQADPESRIAVLELAAALARIDELYAEREREWRQTAAWVETLVDSRERESSPRTIALDRIRRKLEIRKKAEEGQMLAGLDDSLMLLFATLLAGDEAIADLCTVVEDSTLDLDMRIEAFQTLGYLPSDQALEITLHPPEDVAAIDEFKLEQQLGKLALLADFLPPESIAPHANTLFGVAARALDSNPVDTQAWRLIASLAWEHRHAEAIKTLDDPRNTRLFGAELLTSAWWSASDGGWDYIERMSRTHPDPEIRRQASEILAVWPPS